MFHADITQFKRCGNHISLLPRQEQSTSTDSDIMAPDTSQEEKNTMTTMEAMEPEKDITGYEDEAVRGTEQEKTMPLKAAFKYYRKAVFWSITICE